MLLTEFSFRTVPLASITFDRNWSLHPWAEEVPAEVEKSFKESGILHPPCLIPKGEDNFAILAGRRRLLFWQKEKGEKEILCKCYHSLPSPQESLSIVLADQQFCHGELTIAEKARFIQLAACILSIEKKKELESLLPLLGFKKNPELLQNLLKLAKEPREILQAAHKGELSLQIYTELQKIKKEDRAALLTLFSQLQLGGGKQRRFLFQLRDCAYAQSLSIVELLQQREFLQIIDDSHLNIPQKTSHLGELLHNLLQPSLRNEEKRFKEQAGQLSLPENYQIAHSPSFEKDDVTLKIVFANFADCKKYLSDHLPEN